MNLLKCDVVLVPTDKPNFAIGGTVKFHIWFVSDRKIEPGTIVYDPHGPNLIGYVGNGWHEDCKKVEATSDDTFYFPRGNLRLISEPFIKKFIHTNFSIKNVFIEMSDTNSDGLKIRSDNTVITHKKQHLYRQDEIKIMIINAVSSYAYKMNSTTIEISKAKGWADDWCNDLF